MTTKTVMTTVVVVCTLFSLAGFSLTGCGNQSAPSDGASTKTSPDGGGIQPDGAPAELKPIEPDSGLIRLTSGEIGTSEPLEQAIYSSPAHAQTERAFDALSRFGRLVGEWHGITTKAIGGAKAAESPVWQWDLLSDPDQPALVLDSSSSPYLREGRLIWDLAGGRYKLIVIDVDGFEQRYEASADGRSASGESTSSEPIELVFMQIDPSSPDEKLVLRSANEDEYVIDVYRNRGGNVLKLYDSVLMKREGGSRTSLIGNTESHDTCIISGGRGRIPVTHEGATFSVCCPGCQAAFEKEPQRWIARYHARSKRQ